ncbi:MAG: ABC-F family ATP-binding cassette domain-containing protein [Candidatus Electrothrix aestuarii]|uniref:ABC-F family ATP-binding cassette domain-containing protein n=1 Tax=Candidatus Electrothrix aestuarii TaxID=3062594 RepID=A0AAU8LRV7_9BACT|nr:ABC-F family ATP-binding cassette domain-containing protein [Candidatus Electrothrix aestuarii]
MSNLLSCRDLSKAFGAQTLFSSVSLVLAKGDRVGLIGPNGSGKSTLLKIFADLIEADSGEIFRQRHVRVSYLAQADVFAEEKSCADNLYPAVEGLHLEEAEQYNRVHSLLSRAEFPDPDSPVGLLSGGWRKRLAICRALVVHPDVLVMDEPTNHLDIEGILWLEKLLKASLPESPDAYLMVSHDRRFLENTVNRIIELSAAYPDGTFQVNGNYSAFLEKRDTFLEQQQEMEERLANKVRRENEWLSRGPKARGTKAKSRKDAAYRLQDELSVLKQRNRVGTAVDIAFDGTDRKTKKLLVATGISKGFGGRNLFSDLDLTLSPGTRLGLLGRNGCGKSTLMQIFAAAGSGEGLQPDTGKVETADNLRIISFDQRREQLDQEQTLRRALAPDGDSVVYQDRSIHVASWAQRFLFRTDQLETPVSRLSGGEQARILIASLMRRPADILLLDEPTNDLDIPSLNVLEQSLNEFAGALVLVTHDRFMLDRICDQVLGFDGKGNATLFADYEQWLAALNTGSDTEGKAEEEKKQSKKKASGKPAPKKSAKKLSYMDQREYDQMEEKILEAETRQEELESAIQEPEIAADPARLAECCEELEIVQKEVADLYARWEELEAMQNGD